MLNFLWPGCSLKGKDLEHHLVWLDASNSLPREVRPAMVREIGSQARDWTEVAPPGSVFEVWASTGEPGGCQRLLAFEMPRLKVPAKEHRRRLADDLQAAIQSLIDRFDRETGHRGSPVLEDAHRLMRRGSSLEGVYRLTLVSDLLQTSPSFIFTADVLRDLSPLQERVLGLLPPPTRPPQSVEILFWPGIVDEGRLLLPREEMALRAFYEGLFTRWGVQDVRLHELRRLEENP